MRFAVLGSVRMWRGAVELEQGPPKQRALLALLLVRADHPVPLHEIVDVLWGTDPPLSAVNGVHRHIGQLRRQVAADEKSSVRISRASGGYRLDLPPDALDLLRFRRLREQGHAEAGRGQDGAALGLLAEALSLWQGPVSSGLPVGMRLHPVFAAADRERVETALEAADAALRCGAPGRILAALRVVAHENPLDEALQAKYMLVLNAHAQQAEALTVYQEVRKRLADELGVDPSAQLRAAQREVLRQTQDVRERSASGPSATGTREGSSASAAQVQPTRQLPPAAATFVGRRQEMETARQILNDTAGQSAGTGAIIVVGGMAGVGKTAFALRCAREAASAFPDGQLYVDLHGFDPRGAPTSPEDAVRGLLEQLGVPTGRLPAGADAQLGLYRSLLSDRRVLVVLDNARDSSQVRPLLPTGPGTLSIVTSRDQLYGLVAVDGARPLSLGVLSPADAVDYLIRRLGRERVSAETEAAAAIADRCGGLPLALAIVAARALIHPRHPLAALVEELRAGHGTLDGFAAGTPEADVRAVFSWSYRTLSPGAARLFRLLPLHGGVSCSVESAASLLAEPVGQARRLLAELVRACLLEKPEPGRLSCHDLVCAYAAELLGTEPPKSRKAAEERFLDHVLHSIRAAQVRLAPHRDHIRAPSPAAGSMALRFAEPNQAVAWLERELLALLATVERDAADGGGHFAWRLAADLEIFLDRTARRHEQVTLQWQALAAAERTGEIDGQAYAHRALGFACGRLSRNREAEAHLAKAAELFAMIDDPVGLARVLRYQAFLANRAGQTLTALERYRRAEALYEKDGYQAGVVAVLNEQGWTHVVRGEHPEARALCRRAIRLGREIADANHEAAAWDTLGWSHHHSGYYERALACFSRALQLYRALSDFTLQADTLIHTGDTQDAMGNRDAARWTWSEALQLLKSHSHPDAEEITARLKSKVGSPPITPAGGG